MEHWQTGNASPIHHVVFDAVGTLIRPIEPVAASYHRIGARFGSQRTLAQVRQRFSTAFDQFYRQRSTSSEAAERECWRQIVTEVLDDVDDAEQCFRELFDYFGSVSSWQVYSDVTSCLDSITKLGINVSIASNFDSRLNGICNADPVLASIDRRVLSVDAGHKKPDRRFFQFVENVLKTGPQHLLMVGDDTRADIVGATAAGWHAVWLNRKSRMRPAAIGEVPEIDSLDRLGALLGHDQA